MANSRVTYHSRIPEIIAQLPDRATDTASMVADETVALAVPQAPVAEPWEAADPGALKRSIRAEKRREEAVVVLAAWYWFFVEFGTRYQSAQPFLMPAYDVARVQIDKMAKVAFAGL